MASARPGKSRKRTFRPQFGLFGYGLGSAFMVSGRIAFLAQQAFDQPQISVDGSRCVESACFWWLGYQSTGSVYDGQGV